MPRGGRSLIARHNRDMFPNLNLNLQCYLALSSPLRLELSTTRVPRRTKPSTALSIPLRQLTVTGIMHSGLRASDILQQIHTESLQTVRPFKSLPSNPPS